MTLNDLCGTKPFPNYDTVEMSREMAQQEADPILSMQPNSKPSTKNSFSGNYSSDICEWGLIGATFKRVCLLNP